MPSTMPPRVREAFEGVPPPGRARTSPDPAGRWSALERAHVLSQPWAWPHTRAHWAMFRLALRHRDRREAAGQVVRLLVAAPGSLTGRAPLGNNGRTAAGLFTPMTVPEDLALLLPDRPGATPSGAGA